ncbi:MAG: YHYH protein [Fimbriimonadaceae bacterium]|nr:YHYH protein [Fimbriimonadaceae bacterium]
MEIHKVSWKLITCCFAATSGLVFAAALALHSSTAHSHDSAGGLGSFTHSHDGSTHAHTEAEEQALAQSRVKIEVKDGVRYIDSNGIPNHSTGAFPNRGNPNRITEQNYRFQVTADPKPAASLTPLQHQPFGIAINGVVFDPGTAEFWNGDPQWNYEALSGKINLGVDLNKAHVQPTGAYHYHGVPTGLMNNLDGSHKMALLGYAADGYPIYGPYSYSDPMDDKSPLIEMKSSYRLKKGQRAGGPGGTHDGTFTADYEFVKGSGQLDECNGRFGITPEYPKGTYYYVLTYEFPNIPRQFKGTPDKSFERRGPGGEPPPRRGGPPPPEKS